MAIGRALFIQSGNLKQLTDTDELQFGVWDRATAGALTIGGTNATSLSVGVAATFTASGTALTVNNDATVTGTLTNTGGIYANGGVDRSAAATLSLGTVNANRIDIGQSGVTTYILGDLDVAGAEAFHGIATFDVDATFKGNVTFGDGTGTDTVTFHSATRVTSDITFGTANRTINGAPNAAGNGYTLSVLGGASTGANGNGGDLLLAAGLPNGTGSYGSIVIGPSNIADDTAYQILTNGTDGTPAGIRYANGAGSNKWQLRIDGGAWVDIATGASLPSGTAYQHLEYNSGWVAVDDLTLPQTGGASGTRQLSVQANAVGAGDNLYVSGGAALGSSGAGGGAAVLQGGLSDGTGTTGLAAIRSQVAPSTGNTGSVSVYSGDTTTGTSGAVVIQSGTATGAGTSGDVTIVTGGTSGGTYGNLRMYRNIKLQSVVGTEYARVNFMCVNKNASTGFATGTRFGAGTDFGMVWQYKGDGTQVTMETAAVDTAGGPMTFGAGAGGAASTGPGGGGGTVTLEGGAGGASAVAQNAGAGGVAVVTGGVAGVASGGSGNGGAGGDVQITATAGGNSASGTGGAGGIIYLTPGLAGTGGSPVDGYVRLGNTGDDFAYLMFENTAIGAITNPATSGAGFRADDSGVMQFRNEGGDWTSFGSGTVPDGTAQYQHLEWTGAAWSAVDDLTLPNGANRTIAIADSGTARSLTMHGSDGAAATNSGGATIIRGGAGNTTGTGGDVLIDAGASGSGTGGALKMSGGDSTSGTPGEAWLNGGVGDGVYADIYIGNESGGTIYINQGVTWADTSPANGIEITAQAASNDEGGYVSIYGGSSAAAGSVGGAVGIQGGTSTSGTGTGGDASLQGGTCTSGNGGDANVFGGTGNVAGDVNIKGGNGNISGTAGAVNITGGETLSSGTPGGVVIAGGSVTTGTGANVTIRGGSGSVANGVVLIGDSNTLRVQIGGTASTQYQFQGNSGNRLRSNANQTIVMYGDEDHIIRVADASTQTDGGDLQVVAGDASTGNGGVGGGLSLTAGDGDGAGTGGSLYLQAGGSGSGAGGTVTIRGGNSTTGTDGLVVVGDSDTSLVRIGNATNYVSFDVDATPPLLSFVGTATINLPGAGTGTNFQINSVGVGNTVTAPNLDTLTDGSNADALHTHTGLGTAAFVDVALTQGTAAVNDVCYVVNNGGTANADKTDNTAAATADKCKALGVYGQGGADTVRVTGLCSVVCEDASSPGDDVYLSETTTGRVQVAVPTTTGRFLTFVGKVKVGGGVGATISILVQPARPIGL